MHQHVIREADTAFVVNPRGKPIVYQGRAVRTVTVQFLADLNDHWQKVSTKVLDAVAEKFPEIYFQGMIQLAKINRIEIGGRGDFDRATTKAEIMQRLEERVGLEGRRIFERFVQRIERLEAARAEEADNA